MVDMAKSFLGHWVTILDRSDSLDGHYRTMGIGFIKRQIMNRLSVPLTFFLENEGTVIHTHIHTPLGLRHMRADLTGETTLDVDPDCGIWYGQTPEVIDFSIPWYCDGKPVRAFEQARVNENVGTSMETKVILPDADHGTILLYNFKMIPKDGGETHTADRILKFVRD
eukprot:Trichotokara_eunicae@DN5249_c0_g1_i2.p1